MQTNSSSRKAAPQETKRMFSFTGATGWRQGPTNETSMALFGNERKDKTSACFTSIEYHHGTIDVQSEVQKMTEDSNSLGNTITEIATQPLSLNTVNDKRYVGSAVNFGARWKEHRHVLKRGTHHSCHLQNAWVKHGEDAFVFRRLIVCLWHRPSRGLRLPSQYDLSRTHSPRFDCRGGHRGTHRQLVLR